MRTHLLIAAALAFTATGCIVEHDIVREPAQSARIDAPPGPPQDDADGEVTAPPPVERNVDTQVFYDRLSPYGHWEYTPEYGRVWVPSVAANWHPYYYGHWVLTDWGWTFASADPWGWAAYHYGSWGYGPSLGWYWVPGSVWAPAWVSWRYGGGYVTWCPIGPRGYVYGYDNAAWIAVREQHFTQPIATAAVPGHATAGIVQGAAPLSGPHATPVKGGAFGPPVAQVAAATGQQLHPVSAAAAVGQPRPRPMASNSDGYRQPGSDPIRSPAPRASPSGESPAARPSAGAQGSPVVRPGVGGYGRGSADAPAPRGSGDAPAPRAQGRGNPQPGSGDAPAPRGLGRGNPQQGGGDAPVPRGLGRGSPQQGGGDAPAPRGLGRGRPQQGGGDAPAPRGLGRGSAQSGGGQAPRSSGGGEAQPAPAPRSSSGGGGSHPAPAPAPAPRSSGGGHDKK